MQLYTDSEVERAAAVRGRSGAARWSCAIRALPATSVVVMS